MLQGLMVCFCRRNLCAVLFSILFFALLPATSGAKIIMKKQYGPSVFPLRFNDIPWVYSPIEACNLSFERRATDWPPPEWQIVKDNPYVQTGGGQPNGCGITRMRNGENWGSQATGLYVRYAPCPPNSYPGGAAGECECNQGYTEVGNSCEPLPPPPPSPPPVPPDFTSGPPPQMCPAQPQGGESTPFPILLAAAQKYQREIDYVDHFPHPLDFGRYYLSRRPAGESNLGGGWVRSFSDFLSYRAETGADFALAIITHSDGSRLVFSQVDGAWQPNDSADTLTQNTQGWVHTSSADNIVRHFGVNGKLLTLNLRNGWTYQYGYDSQGRLSQVTNHFGRSLQLAYNAAGQLASVSVGGQVQASYEYDSAQRLAIVMQTTRPNRMPTRTMHTLRH